MEAAAPARRRRRSSLELAATVLRELPVAEYPFLAEHIEQHLKEPGDEDVGTFEFGLDLILDGRERLEREEVGRGGIEANVG